MYAFAEPWKMLLEGRSEFQEEAHFMNIQTMDSGAGLLLISLLLETSPWSHCKKNSRTDAEILLNFKSLFGK